MKRNITHDSILVRNGSIPTATIDGEVGLMNIETGKYYALNSIGSDIWNKLDKPISLNDLVAALVSEFDIDRQECYSQVKKFVERLIEEGIVIVSN